MDTYFLVRSDGSFYEQDGRTLFGLEEANEISGRIRGLSITPAFTIPAS